MRAELPPAVPRPLFLHPPQWEVYFHPARFKVVVAGRRFGKGELGATTLLLGGPGVTPDAPRRGCLNDTGIYRYIAPTQKLARKTFWRRKLKRLLDPTWLKKPPNETNLEIEFVSGAVLEILGAEDPDALRGEGVSGVVLDEFDDWRELAWEEAVRPSLSDLQGWALFLGTPKAFGKLHALYQRGQQDTTGRWASWQFRSLDNPLMDPEEVESAKADLDERTFRQEYEASFEAIAGRAYYAFRRQDHVAPVALEPSVPVCLSFDFNINPATAIIAQRVRDDLRVWREVYLPLMGGEATRAAAHRCKELLYGARWSGKLRIYGDPSGRAGKTTGPSDHAVLKETFFGSQWCIRDSAPHVRDKVAAVNGRCQTMDGKRHLIVDPACVELINDLEQVTFTPNGELDKSNPKRTHVSDAMAYLCEYEWPPRGGIVVAPLAGLRV